MNIPTSNYYTAKCECYAYYALTSTGKGYAQIEAYKHFQETKHAAYIQPTTYEAGVFDWAFEENGSGLVGGIN
jgi:hypothetical protein